MPIGDILGLQASSRMGRTLIKYTGIIDLHSHLRIKPLLRYFMQTSSGQSAQSILEIGCGGGINLFEIAKVIDAKGVGYDLNCESIGRAQAISEEAFDNRISFHCDDARDTVYSGSYDHILFIDFLEHVPDPASIIKELDGCLTPGGCIVISVPTTNYPAVFGRRFHEKVGHVMDGYTLKALSALMPANYELTHSSYNTGAMAALGCFVHYRLVDRIPSVPLRTLFSLMLQPFRWFDLINGRAISSSLFAIYRKVQ